MKPSSPTAAGIAEAVSYAASHGIIVCHEKHATPGTNITHVPITYHPTPLHAASYHEAVRITPILNLLVSRIAADHSYLRRALFETAAVDPFTHRLMSLLGSSPPDADIYLGIYRYDYFVNVQNQQHSLRMVEMNCIAASFACLGTKTSEMHRFLASHPACNFDINMQNLPINHAIQSLARGIATAHTQYIRRHSPPSTVRTVVLLVGQPGERNSYDQDILRIAVWKEHQVEIIRLTLAQIIDQAFLDEYSNLYVTFPANTSHHVLVTTVYFRAGYSPDDYPSEKEWEARALIEKSLAAKCPSIAVQLVGTKKIQQILDLPGEVERFIDSKEDADAIRATFARQYSLSSTQEGAKAAKMAINNPDAFVLKPQREGGGNNLYGEQLKHALQSMSDNERAAYVLMDKIMPPVVKSVLIRDGEPIYTDIVSEFGVYGVHVMNGTDHVENESGGTLLRSKPASQDDGGVAAGVAVLDSPLLVDYTG